MIGAYVTTLFGGGTGPVFLDEVQCVGTENELLSCLNAGIGHHKCGEGLEAHKFDVGIVCAGMKSLSPTYNTYTTSSLCS